MKIGYYVQGDADEAVVRGLARRWCPEAALAPGHFRGSSRESFRRELRKSLMDLAGHKACSVVVVLTDADVSPWREVRRREAARIPESYRHVTVFGVADWNIEWWLAVDRNALAQELGCGVEDIPRDEPHLSSFVKRRFGLTDRDTREDAKERVCAYVRQASLRTVDSGLGLVRGLLRRSAQLGCTERMLASERAGSLMAPRSGVGS